MDQPTRGSYCENTSLETRSVLLIGATLLMVRTFWWLRTRNRNGLNLPFTTKTNRDAHKNGSTPKRFDEIARSAISRSEIDSRFRLQATLGDKKDWQITLVSLLELPCS